MRDGKLARAANIENHSRNLFEERFPKFSLSEFRAQMQEYGFVDEWDIELLTAKYFYNMSARSIAEDQHYVGKSTVDRRLKELRRLLKERGYGAKRTNEKT